MFEKIKTEQYQPTFDSDISDEAKDLIKQVNLIIKCLVAPKGLSEKDWFQKWYAGNITTSILQGHEFQETWAQKSNWMNKWF